MIPGAVAFLAFAAVAILMLPRRLAVIPLLLTAAYTGRANVIELGPANLSALRILVLIGFARAIVRGERLAGGVNIVDTLLLLWAAMLVGLSAFHTSDAWTFRIGMTLGELGVYFLCRVFLTSAEDVRLVFRVLCVALVPLAAMLIVEKATAHNAFGIMGSAGAANIRDGHVRAYGPFAHPILAGTVGATCIPMAIAIWRTHRAHALAGVMAGLGIVLASTSSGPVMMIVFSVAGLTLWKARDLLGPIRWASVVAILALDAVMKDPVYFLMARIDITGSSTGWHRARLIQSSIEHLDEWWMAGTDYTRHWMPTGVHANAIHTDITNHLLGIGVLGGLPLMAVFVAVLVCAFRAAGSVFRRPGIEPRDAFLAWTLGAMLFGQTMNFWSISLFDQSVSFFYLNLAMIAASRVTYAARRPRLAVKKSRVEIDGAPISPGFAPAAAWAGSGGVTR